MQKGRGNSITRIYGKNKGIYKKNQTVTGIAGIGHGTGVTHFCIWFANYLDSVRRKKVAVIEWNDHSHFTHIEQLCFKKNSEIKPYRIFGVDYYKYSNQQELLMCLESGYDEILIDFGCWQEDKRADFVRCDHQIVIGSLSEWQFEELKIFMVKDKNLYNSWIYLVSFGNEKTRRELKKKVQLPIIRVPYSLDPFTLDGSSIAWFERQIYQNR